VRTERQLLDPILGLARDDQRVSAHWRHVRHLPRDADGVY
jgi:hypothetical protein